MLGSEGRVPEQEERAEHGIGGLVGHGGGRGRGGKVVVHARVQLGGASAILGCVGEGGVCPGGVWVGGAVTAHEDGKGDRLAEICVFACANKQECEC